MSITDWKPVAWITTGVTSVVGLVQPEILEALWMTLISVAPTLFTASSIGAFTLAENLPWLPQRPFTVAAVVFGAIYLGLLISKAVNRFQEELNS